MEDDAGLVSLSVDTLDTEVADAPLAGTKRSRAEMEGGAATTEAGDAAATAPEGSDGEGDGDDGEGGTANDATGVASNVKDGGDDDAAGDKESASFEHGGVTYKLTKVRVAVLFGYLGTRFQGLQK